MVCTTVVEVPFGTEPQAARRSRKSWFPFDDEAGNAITPGKGTGRSNSSVFRACRAKVIAVNDRTIATLTANLLFRVIVLSLEVGAVISHSRWYADRD